MVDMNEFLEMAHRAGMGTLTSLAMAEALEISTSYVQKLRTGVEPVRPKIRAKLEALIEAKANGPGESGFTPTPLDQRTGHPVEQFEVDLPAEPSFPTPEEERYHVSGNADGGWNVVEKVWVVHHSIVAKVPSTAGEDNAKRIAELLNKEGD